MFKLIKSAVILSLLFLLVFGISCVEQNGQAEVGWTGETMVTKPWTRWWWQGSAVTKEGISHELEVLKEAGFGGVEITPIYGVAGYEEQFIPFLSEKWVEMLLHTLQEAERLGLGVDMATGTGWPFGGPWIDEDYACKNFVYKTFELKSGEALTEKIKYTQEPFVRAVGNQIYEMHGIYKVEGQQPKGTINEPLMKRRRNEITIDQLVQPISANQNLQLLALDQVRFERDLPVVAIMAYSESGEKINLMDQLQENGSLNWTAPEGSWTIYALFEGDHGKMVERAAPGGEGNVLDHFSQEAIDKYLSKFDSAFTNQDIRTLRAFFNDSYEVDDARGSADWTPTLIDEFEKRRGYDLRNYLPALFGNDEDAINERVLCDYRETISELLFDNFTQRWKDWASTKDAIIRNQAHGSPANILDLYALSDIPETEGNEALRAKMATSAAHVSGKELASSESATWLNEHFLSNLSDIKNAVDLFLLNGVNHVFYHGTNYSPSDDPWPGWLFYAAIHANDRNPLWNDFVALNGYINRCQSFLQAGHIDNDILLYYPVYDRFSTPGREMIEHFDGVEEQFEGTYFKVAAEEMLEKGYAFDFISDMQIQGLEYKAGELFSGEITYQTIVVPFCKYIPQSTFQKLIDLANSGANVIFYNNLPTHFSGLANLEEKEAELGEIKSSLEFINKNGAEIHEQGGGKLIKGENLETLLTTVSVERESLTDQGLQFIRRERNGQTFYFIKNASESEFDGWVKINAVGETAMLYDPMNGNFGKVKTRSEGDTNQIYLQLNSQESVFVEIFDKNVEGPEFNYFKEAETIQIEGEWGISFYNESLENEITVTLNSLTSWPNIEDNDLGSFSGTARYTLKFDHPELKNEMFRLDLGEVHESAKIILNGKEVGTLIGPVYEIDFSSDMLKENENILEIDVSNLMVNRIIDLEKQDVMWKKFYNVNFPARLQENRGEDGLFTAKNWEPITSGLLGPVRLIALEKIESME